MNDRPVVYWIKCDHDHVPVKHSFATLHDMLRGLSRLMTERGPIEFLVRES